MAQDVVQVIRPVRLTDEERVKRDAHDPAALRPLLVELVELGLADAGEVLAVAPGAEHDAVVDLGRIGNGYEPSRSHPDRDRLVVVKPVAVIEDSRLGQQVGGPFRAGEGRTEESLQPLSGMALQAFDVVPDEAPFLFLGVGSDVLRVVEPVTHERPPPGDHGVLHFGKVIEHRQVERDGAAHRVPVEHFEHAPEPDPVAVVAVRVLLDVGIGRARVGVPLAVEHRKILVVLDVGRYPERHPRPAGPGDGRPVDDRAVVDPSGRHGHGVNLPRTRPSDPRDPGP